MTTLIVNSVLRFSCILQQNLNCFGVFLNKCVGVCVCMHACMCVWVCVRWRERQDSCLCCFRQLDICAFGLDKAPRWPLQDAPCRNSHRSQWGTLSNPWGADVKPWSMHVVTTHVLCSFIFKNTPCPWMQPSMTVTSLLTHLGRWTFEWNCSYSNFNRYTKFLMLEWKLCWLPL